jgi:hypothetical protein
MTHTSLKFRETRLVSYAADVIGRRVTVILGAKREAQELAAVLLTADPFARTVVDVMDNLTGQQRVEIDHGKAEL